MNTMFEEVKPRSANVIQEGCYYLADIRTACTEKKWWRVIAYLVLMMVMLAVVMLVKPLCVVFLIKWFIGTWGFSLIVSKAAATCVVGLITAQVRKGLKSLIKNINF